MKPFVLIVEDEHAISTLLDYNFLNEGFETALAVDGEEALLLISERKPDIVILDWMLPKLSGVEVCRRLRRKAETVDLPIIMLSARGEETDRIDGLDTGADDYMTKPFSTAELMARVRALLRRTQARPLEDTVEAGDIVIDAQAMRVKRGDHDIHLGPTEFRLLEYLMRRPGRVFSREQLLNAVWGQGVYIEDRTVDVHIGRLRKSLKVGGLKDPIRTVRSAGYSFEV